MRDGETLGERVSRPFRVLADVDELDAAAAVEPGDLTGLVVGTGPGSFTGLRMGLAPAGVSRFPPASLRLASTLDAGLLGGAPARCP